MSGPSPSPIYLSFSYPAQPPNDAQVSGQDRQAASQTRISLKYTDLWTALFDAWQITEHHSSDKKKDLKKAMGSVSLSSKSTSKTRLSLSPNEAPLRLTLQPPAVLQATRRKSAHRPWPPSAQEVTSGSVVAEGHGLQHLVQQLQRPVQLNLDPARRLLDALARVVGPPSLDEAEPEDAEAAQVVHPDARCCRQPCSETRVGVNTVVLLFSLFYFQQSRRRTRVFWVRHVTCPPQAQLYYLPHPWGTARDATTPTAPHYLGCGQFLSATPHPHTRNG